MSVNNNTGPADVVGNNVSGTLQCLNDTICWLWAAATLQRKSQGNAADVTLSPLVVSFIAVPCIEAETLRASPVAGRGVLFFLSARRRVKCDGRVGPA